MPPVTCPHCQSEDTASLAKNGSHDDEPGTWHQCGNCRRVWSEEPGDAADDEDDDLP